MHNIKINPRNAPIMLNAIVKPLGPSLVSLESLPLLSPSQLGFSLQRGIVQYCKSLNNM